MNPKPITVLISDLHFNVQNLELSSTALATAIGAANNLRIPLVIAGDLNDSKAIIRAEVANRLILLLKEAKTLVYILVGNHDLVNEKGKEHGLNYLKPYATIVDHIIAFNSKFVMMPYYSNMDLLKYHLSKMPKDRNLIMHQGFQGAVMGDYIVDKTSISTDLVKDFRVFSGHYHKHQTIGTVTYIGNPYTMSFGEANDGPKGFLILNDDGTYTREILDLPAHIILDHHVDSLHVMKMFKLSPSHKVWLKIRGTTLELSSLKKSEIGLKLLGHNNYRLEFIPTDSAKIELQDQNLTDYEILDKIIETTGESAEQQKYLKEVYREVIKD